MSSSLIVRWLGRLGAVALVVSLVDCAPTRTAAVVAPAITPGQARIWFYRVWDPSVSLNVANIALNGAPAGSVLPNGPGLYRDVAPGHYHLIAQSYESDPRQAADVDLAAGQEVFAKIVGSPNTSSDGDQTSFHRDDFFIRLVSPELARAEIASGPT